MNRRNRNLKNTATFFERLRKNRGSLFLAYEGLLTGGLYWWLKAKLTELITYFDSKDQYEATGPEHKQLYKKWQSLEERACYGKALTKAQQETVFVLDDLGIPTPRIRTWFVNNHIDENGKFTFNDRHANNHFLRILGWLWHAIVILTALLFLAYALCLEGAVWRKIIAMALVLGYFSVMSALMNSKSLSALPPSTFYQLKLKETGLC